VPTPIESISFEKKEADALQKIAILEEKLASFV
jgi:hypothetical protein